MTGTVCCWKVSALISPQSFSQKIPGPFPLPEKQPQNIQPCFRWCSSTMQSGFHSSPVRRVTYCLLWAPPVIQVSAVQRILLHCSRVQLRCSCAQARRVTRSFSEIGGFIRATRLRKPRRQSVRLITQELYRPSKHCVDSSRNPILLFFREAQTNSTSSCSCCSESARGRPV